MNVVWLIQNLVPYHHARFEAFAREFDGNAHLIQVTDQDEFNVLEFEAPEQSYQLHTLFPGEKRSALSGKKLKEKLDSYLGAIRPDCICVSGWGMEIGQLMQLWAIHHNVPTVMFSESTSYDMSRSAWKEWIKKKIVQASSAALVGGKPHAEYIEQLGMDPHAVFLGHNVVDSSHFAAEVAVRPPSLPESLSDIPYLVVCTRFGLKKNIPTLVRAYAQYDQRCRETSDNSYKLIIAGDGELRSEIESAISETKVGDNVTLLGAVGYDALPWLYQNAQAFVHASTTEQWGLVVNEAMAAGAPVLISRQCGCAPDLVRDGENGLQFDPYSEVDMANTLWKFHHLSGEKRLSLGEHGRQLIKDWGPPRFALSLVTAVNTALRSSAKKNTPVTGLLLRFLLAKG